jgi:parallel beta-helix repeat protein
MASPSPTATTSSQRLVVDNGGGGEYNPSTEGYDWRGVIPRFGVDLEAINSIDDDGNLVRSEVLDRIIIRNNVFAGNYQGDIDLYKCQNVLIYNNTLGGSIGSVAPFNITIVDNVLIDDKANGGDRTGIHIRTFIRTTGDEQGHFSVNWNVSRNEVHGFYTAFTMGSKGSILEDNVATGFRNGISMLGGEDLILRGNYLETNVSSAKGITCFPLGIEGNNILLEKNVVRTAAAEHSYGIDLPKAVGPIEFRSNDLDTRVRFENCEHIALVNNTYTSSTITGGTNVTETGTNFI